MCCGLVELGAHLEQLSIHIDRGCENEVEEKVKKLKKETRYAGLS